MNYKGILKIEVIFIKKKLISIQICLDSVVLIFTKITSLNKKQIKILGMMIYTFKLENKMKSLKKIQMVKNFILQPYKLILRKMKNIQLFYK